MNKIEANTQVPDVFCQNIPHQSAEAVETQEHVNAHKAKKGACVSPVYGLSSKETSDSEKNGIKGFDHEKKAKEGSGPEDRKSPLAFTSPNPPSSMSILLANDILSKDAAGSWMLRQSLVMVLLNVLA